MTSPKILYCANSAFAFATFLRPHLEVLSRRGFQIVVALPHNAPPPAYLAENGIEVHFLAIKREIAPCDDLRCFWQLWNLIRAVRPDIINVTTPKMGLLGSIAAFLARTPIRIYTMRGLRLETKRDLEQVHLCIGVPSLPLAHERRFGVAVLNNLLGGGMSSRLFQSIREKQGLAYAVFSEITPYSDAGMLTVYAGTAKETVDKVLDMTVAEFRSMKESPVSTEELLRAKNHLKGSLMLSLESTSSRMSNLARQELYFQRFYSLDEILASIEAVTRDEVQSLAREFFQPERIAVTVLGPLNGFSVDRARLAC